MLRIKLLTLEYPRRIIIIKPAAVESSIIINDFLNGRDHLAETADSIKVDMIIKIKIVEFINFNSLFF